MTPEILPGVPYPRNGRILREAPKRPIKKNYQVVIIDPAKTPKLKPYKPKK